MNRIAKFLILIFLFYSLGNTIVLAEQQENDFETIENNKIFKFNINPQLPTFNFRLKVDNQTRKLKLIEISVEGKSDIIQIIDDIDSLDLPYKGTAYFGV